MLDLTNWNSQITSKMPLDLEVVLDSDYYQETEIQGLSPIHVNGVIYWNDNDELTADLQITGTMKLLDAIDMQEVDYPFAVTLSEDKIENFKKDQNTLDLNELLWENIVLEIPLKYTKVEDFSNIQGTGWKLISEEDQKQMNNPFRDLKSKLGEE